jgi:hypothetical protein
LGLTAIVLFVVSFVFHFAHARAYLPVISNDAVTYHFPAATQWLQDGCIDLFQTWFFNPANTYSPLAGSIFITWLMVPFGSDVLARFVEVPPLLCVGLGMYRFCLQIGEPGRLGPENRGGTPRLSMALIAAAAIFARPIFEPCMMGKDDLFVAFFFIASLVALSPKAARDPYGPMRLGIALGLLLATKYTALMCAPILLLALGGQRWSIRQWTIAISIAAAFAGPWYLRNWIITGNPLFPLEIPHVFHGLFTTSRSQSFGSLTSAFNVVAGGAYGLPMALVVALLIAWILCLPSAAKGIWRVCVIGPVMGFAIFFWRSPFPEVRFLLPAFLLLFACAAFAINGWCRNEKLMIALGGALLAISLLTVFDRGIWFVTAEFAGVSILIAGIGVVCQWWAGNRRIRWIGIGAGLSSLLLVYAYINWAAYSKNYLADQAYATQYADLVPLWNAVNTSIPADATVAYTNMYLIYPIQEHSPQRRLVYVPTRRGVSSIADLGWLGSGLSGEALVPATVNATFALPDRNVWLTNLKRSDAQYVVIGRGNAEPPEAGFVASDPMRFKLMFQCPAGWVYQIKPRRGGD